MALAVYLKDFTSELTKDANAQLKKLTELTLK